MVRDEVRRLISVEKIRPDGRKPDEIRPLDSQIQLLPRAHGSGLFTRGQTQALSVCTLGALGDVQILDGLDLEESKRFMHQDRKSTRLNSSHVAISYAVFSSKKQKI